MRVEASTAGKAALRELEAEARYARERYQLYKARAYGSRMTSRERLRELERKAKLAQARPALAAPQRGSAGRVDATRARGPRADGDRRLEPGHRRQVGDHRSGRREVRVEHLRQARPSVDRQRVTPCPGGPGVSPRLTPERTKTPETRTPDW